MSPTRLPTTTLEDTDTSSALRDALTTKGICRTSLTLHDVVKVAHHSVIFRLSLKCIIDGFLISDELLVREVNTVAMDDYGLGSGVSERTSLSSSLLHDSGR